MTYIAGLLVAALVIQHWFHGKQMDDLLAETSHERRLLLDRIQHPTVRQVEPGPQIEYDPPKDSAELAQVGQIVPDGYYVGENGANHES